MIGQVSTLRFIGRAFGTSAGLAVVGMAVYASVVGGWETVLASCLLFAGAAAVLGAMLGFLFGVPRVVGEAGTTTGAATLHSGAPTYSANTNLEQVSDWLTKILVGIGLTQIGTISSAAQRLFSAQAPSLGGQPSAAPVAGAIDIYFLGVGFITGWLLTRLFLQGLMRVADAARVIQEAAKREQEGDTFGAVIARQQALDLLSPLGAMYDSTRRSMSPGFLRTTQMQRIFDQARQAAEKVRPTVDEVRTLFARGGAGERIAALAAMYSNPPAVDLNSLVEAVEHGRTPFEQYQALVVTEHVLPSIDAQQQVRLRQAVSTALASRMGRDRVTVAQRILGIAATGGAEPNHPDTSPPADPPESQGGPSTEA